MTVRVCVCDACHSVVCWWTCCVYAVVVVIGGSDVKSDSDDERPSVFSSYSSTSAVDKPAAKKGKDHQRASYSHNSLCVCHNKIVSVT